MKDLFDSRMIIWIVGIVFLAGGGWYSLKDVSEDVSQIQTTLDQQSDSLTEHVTGDGHATRGIEIAVLESDQVKIETKLEQLDSTVDKISRNQARMCTAWGVSDCE